MIEPLSMTSMSCKAGKKASMKPNPLVRKCHFLILKQKDEDKVLMKYCAESQFSYCPVIWMFMSRKVDKRKFVFSRITT